MARKPRIEQPGGFYWVTARCVRGTRMAGAERDLFLQVLAQVVSRHRWVCPAYAVLESGYEIVVQTPGANLSKGMRDLNGEFTQAVNRRRGRSGPVFQGRFKAAAVESGQAFLDVCRAVLLAPVRAGLCGKPGKWGHCSYAPLSGQGEVPAFLDAGWVSEHFGGKPKKARARLEKFVKSGASGAPPAVKQGLFVGSEAFGERLTRGRALPAKTSSPAKSRPALRELFAKAIVADPTRRDERIAQARIAHGYTLAEIAEATGLHPATISRIARKKERESRRAGEPGKKKGNKKHR